MEGLRSALLAVFCATLALFGIAGLISNLTTIQEDAINCVKAAKPFAAES